MRIAFASDQDDVLRCFPVMVQLRPHLSQTDFRQRVADQQIQGYQLVFLEVDGEVKAVAGFRPMLNLVHGRFLYVDDLVTDQQSRSQGYGHQLLAWLEAYAAGQGFASLQLDSGLQRQDAHRFYRREGLIDSSLHFYKPLPEARADQV